MTTAIAELPDIIANAENLPSPPAVAVEVLRLTRDDSVSIEELASVISRDPALAAKLLKLSNSSLFRRGDEVTTVERATMMLGLKTVKLMALSFSLAEALPREGGSRYDYDAYWRHSLITAVAARSLARLVKNRLFDEGFMAGLLSRIGQLAMAETLGDQFSEVCDTVTGALPTTDSEQRVLGFDHHQVGSALLESWELPAVIVNAVRYQGTPADFAGEEALESNFVYIMHMALHATSVICDSRKGPALQSLNDLATEHFELPESEVEAFLIGLQTGIAETASLLNIDLGDTVPHDEILQNARMQMVNISLGTAMDLKQTTDRAEKLEREKQELREQATTDKLTGLPNRHAFEDFLRDSIAARCRGEHEDMLGLLIMDVDKFKNFNDTYGHAIGDDVLKLVGREISEATRESDLSARYGGEEFVVVIPEATEESMLAVAERIRKRIETAPLETEEHGPLSVTISVGGAGSAEVKKFEEGTDLLKIADECLYGAKEAGRNRSICRTVDQSAV